jgi:hypothetical protein
MIKKIFIFTICIFCLLLSSCKQKADPAALDKFFENKLSEWNQHLTRVIISDIYTPPVCSRIYAYTSIAAYEALVPAYKNYLSYAGKLNGLHAMSLPANGISYNYQLASIIAFSTVAQKMVFNADAIKQNEKDFLNQLEKLNINEALLDSSVAYGRAVGNHIIEWAAKDGYLQRNAMPAYIVTEETGRWQPTPPNYTDAIEPNWKTLRPMTLDTCSQFRPIAPTKYDTAKGSAFYKEALDVFDKINHPAAGDSATAWYWDDNPNTSVTDGHITYFLQKNSPGGHWIHIAYSVAQKEKYDAIKTAALVSKTAIALYDGFISCWDSKYIYNYIRPETFINQYINKDWMPLIQTPPFPEYPSGHSVVSSSAATVLTKMVGDNYAFTDSAEVAFGRPTRHFNSFYEAADQASVSRLYGGIHFITAITNGKEEGRKVGAFVLDKLKLNENK